MEYGKFKALLMKHKAREALYLDSGKGWNYGWFRLDDTTTMELHRRTHHYCTNWIVFYK